MKFNKDATKEDRITFVYHNKTLLKQAIEFRQGRKNGMSKYFQDLSNDVVEKYLKEHNKQT